MKSRRARRLALAGGIGAAGVGATILGITALGTAAAASHPTLVVYSAQGYDKAMVAAFEHKYPSIPVTLNDNSTGPLLTQVEAERNNPPVGIAVGRRRNSICWARHSRPSRPPDRATEERF